MTCPRLAETVDVGLCYLCDDAWEIRPVMGSGTGWVRWSYGPDRQGDDPTEA